MNLFQKDKDNHGPKFVDSLNFEYVLDVDSKSMPSVDLLCLVQYGVGERGLYAALRAREAYKKNPDSIIKESTIRDNGYAHRFQKGLLKSGMIVSLEHELKTARGYDKLQSEADTVLERKLYGIPQRYSDSLNNQVGAVLERKLFGISGPVNILIPALLRGYLREFHPDVNL